MINTLDLDNITKDELDRITLKILSNDCCLSLKSKPSSLKGYHVIFECSKECDLCRLVFDDDKRFAVDAQMPLKFQNFLFQDKIYFGEKKITKENLEKIKELYI